MFFFVSFLSILNVVFDTFIDQWGNSCFTKKKLSKVKNEVLVFINFDPNGWLRRYVSSVLMQ